MAGKLPGVRRRRFGESLASLFRLDPALVPGSPLPVGLCPALRPTFSPALFADSLQAFFQSSRDNHDAPPDLSSGVGATGRDSRGVRRGRLGEWFASLLRLDAALVPRLPVPVSPSQTFGQALRLAFGAALFADSLQAFFQSSRDSHDASPPSYSA